MLPLQQPHGAGGLAPGMLHSCSSHSLPLMLNLGPEGGLDPATLKVAELQPLGAPGSRSQARANPSGASECGPRRRPVEFGCPAASLDAAPVAQPR